MAVNVVPKDDAEIFSEFEAAGARKIFMVCCAYCTAIGYALKKETDFPAYVSFSFKGLNVAPLTDEIDRLTQLLEERGLHAKGSYTPLGFPCFPFPYMSKRYEKKSRGADTILALACENAKLNIQNALGNEKKVIATMKYKGYARAGMVIKRGTIAIDKRRQVSLACADCAAKGSK